MSIMEKNLPIAESLSEGDKVRIVTNEGNSKNIDANQIGGGTFIIETEDESTRYVLNHTFNELKNAITAGKVFIFRHLEEDEYGEYYTYFIIEATMKNGNPTIILIHNLEASSDEEYQFIYNDINGNGYQFYASSPDVLMTTHENI